ncbi:hypothetical protein Scep_001337 [Stephania cephalantha]|uniref:Uncharacterized protein n=1 Tax=Stephania cephalantha TaxID=152367 RepID=A0AAP0L7Z6_9MAGN
MAIEYTPPTELHNIDLMLIKTRVENEALNSKIMKDVQKKTHVRSAVKRRIAYSFLCV